MIGIKKQKKMIKSNRNKSIFAYPKRTNACLISEFEVVNPTNEFESIGLKFTMDVKGRYRVPGRILEYSLLFLLDHPLHYRISKVVMNGIQYVIPVDREKNWFPKTHPETYKFKVK